MAWLDDAIVVTREERETKINKYLLAIARLEAIEAAMINQGLKTATIEEAENWITTRMDRPGTQAEKLEDIKSIFLKMIPYILPRFINE